jgi:hypothetical protein
MSFVTVVKLTMFSVEFCRIYFLSLILSSIFPRVLLGFRDISNLQRGRLFLASLKILMY